MRLLRAPAAKSGSWAAVLQATSTASVALTSVLVARAYSVTDFGVFSVAMSASGIITALMTAGLISLAVRLIVARPEQSGQILSSLIGLRLLFVTLGILGAFALLTVDEDGAEKLVFLVLLLAVLPKSFEAVEFWYQANVDSGAYAKPRLLMLIASLAIRALAIAFGAPFLVSMILILCESLALAITSQAFYRFAHKGPPLSAPGIRGIGSLLSLSYLLLLSSLAVQINLRADQLMIDSILGTDRTAIYAAAARVSEVVNLLPIVYSTATFPALLACRKKHGPLSAPFLIQVRRSLAFSFLAGLTFGSALAGLSTFMMPLVFGPEYAESGPLLAIQCIALPFVFMSAVLGKWIVAEGWLGASLARNVAGASLNVGLNLWAIPAYGLTGAAWSTVVSYITANFIGLFLDRRSRVMGRTVFAVVIKPWSYLRQGA